jgi:S-adenosylmethionine hydrolase
MIVLMTDFGLKDPYVGIMKGVIKKISPQSEIIDLTHEIPPHNITVASFVLKHSCEHFPDKTVFVAVVDPGVGTHRKPVAIKTDRFFFIGPDNGTFSFVKEKSFGKAEFTELTEKRYYYRENPDNTFHGRDIFAPVAAYIEKGVPFSRLGTPVDAIYTIDMPEYRETPGGIEIPLMHTDHFGNLIFSLTREIFEKLRKGRSFTLDFLNYRIDEISPNYESGSPLIALFNSYGLLEIAAPSQSAVGLTKLSEFERKESIFVTLIFH